MRPTEASFKGRAAVAATPTSQTAPTVPLHLPAAGPSCQTSGEFWGDVLPQGRPSRPSPQGRVVFRPRSRRCPGSRCVCTFPQPPSPLSQWTHTHALPRRLPPFSRSGGIGSLLSCCYLFATEDRALRIILCKRPVLFIPSNCLAGHSRVICRQKLLFSFSFQSVLSQTESLTLNYEETAALLADSATKW